MCNPNCRKIIRSWTDEETGERKHETEDGAVWTEGTIIKPDGQVHALGKHEWGGVICSYATVSATITTSVM